MSLKTINSYLQHHFHNHCGQKIVKKKIIDWLAKIRNLQIGKIFSFYFIFSMLFEHRCWLATFKVIL